MIVGALFFNSLNLKSQNLIEFSDTTLFRGNQAEIPIYGSVNKSNIKSIEITFEYNALNLDIKSVYGNTDFAMKCLTLVSNNNMIDLINSKFTVFCNDVQNVSNGIICKIIVEGLAGPDSVTFLTPKSIKINDTIVSDVILQEGKIRIPGEPVDQQYPEGIGKNYPNPFNESTTFPLSINYKTMVSFNIYTTDGRFILSNEYANDMLELSFFDNRHNKIPITNLKSPLERGNYELRLNPDHMRFASGEYYLIMITEDKVYHRNFIYLK